MKRKALKRNRRKKTLKIMKSVFTKDGYVRVVNVRREK